MFLLMTNKQTMLRTSFIGQFIYNVFIFQGEEGPRGDPGPAGKPGAAVSH